MQSNTVITYTETASLTGKTRFCIEFPNRHGFTTTWVVSGARAQNELAAELQEALNNGEEL